MLYTVHLFPKIHSVNLNRYRMSCNPDIQNIADFRGTLASQDKSTGVLVTEVADDVISDIFHSAFLPFSRARSKARCDRMEGLQT